MRRPSALPVMIQVAALAAFAIVLSHAVAFAVLALSPEPRPAGFSIEAAATALKGEAADTADGRVLKRRLSGQPVVPPGQDAVDPLALALRSGLARSLDVPIERVAVAIERPERRRGPMPVGPRAGPAGEKARPAVSSLSGGATGRWSRGRAPRRRRRTPVGRSACNRKSTAGRGDRS